MTNTTTATTTTATTNTKAQLRALLAQAITVNTAGIAHQGQLKALVVGTINFLHKTGDINAYNGVVSRLTGKTKSFFISKTKPIVSQVYSWDKKERKFRGKLKVGLKVPEFQSFESLEARLKELRKTATALKKAEKAEQDRQAIEAERQKIMNAQQAYHESIVAEDTYQVIATALHDHGSGLSLKELEYLEKLILDRKRLLVDIGRELKAVA